MNIKPEKSADFGVWERHQKIFALIASNPKISAPSLVQFAAENGIKLSVSSAYRFLTKYWRSPKDVGTKARKILPLIMGFLKNLPEGEHNTAAQLQASLEEKGYKVHISTVYRELKCLVLAKLVLMRRSGRITYYEWQHNEAPHGHMVCSICGHTIEFALENLESFAEPVSTRLGYSYSGCEFVLQGQCKKCLMKNNASE